jgi:hypothetical protein
VASEQEAALRNSSPDLVREEASPDGSSNKPSTIRKLSLILEAATELTRLLFRTLGDLGLALGDLGLILPPGDFGRFPRVDLDAELALCLSLLPLGLSKELERLPLSLVPSVELERFLVPTDDLERLLLLSPSDA